MLVHKKEAVAIRKALAAWQETGDIDKPLADRLAASIEIATFNWRALARYAFLVAIVCIVIAVAALFADEAFLRLIERIFDTSHGLRALALAAIAVGLYWLGYTARRLHPQRIFSSEAVLFLGVLATAGAVLEFGAAIDSGSGHFPPLFLLSCAVYAVLGYALRSQLIWAFALFSLGSYMGAETGYVSGWGAYYLGMNYPLRFVLMGGVLIAVAALLGGTRRTAFLRQTTLVIGLLDLFIALWLLSIFGNYGDIDSWYSARQIELFHWSLLFALAAVAAITHGLRYDDATTKGFGLTFLFINLYTRFFEYFWDAAPKAVFFIILAASFWLIGRKAETIWTLGRDGRPPSPSPGVEREDGPKG